MVFKSLVPVVVGIFFLLTVSSYLFTVLLSSYLSSLADRLGEVYGICLRLRLFCDFVVD